MQGYMASSAYGEEPGYSLRHGIIIIILIA